MSKYIRHMWSHDLSIHRLLVKVANRILALVPFGAWSEKKLLKIYNDSHPASNFTEGCKDYGDKRMKEYRVVKLQVDTVDNIMKSLNTEKVDLVSITTNGAEIEIINGMQETIASGMKYIALACTGEGYADKLASFGYELVAHDDRGYTFCRKDLKQ